MKIKHGFAFKGEHFSDRGDYILLTPGNLDPKGGLKLKGEKETYYTGDFPRTYVLSKGDLVVVMTDLTQDASILGGAMLIDKSDLYLHNQRLGLVTHTDEIDRRFLYYYFNWQFFRDQVKASSNGATVKHTSPGRIYRCRIVRPPLPTQRNIAAVLSACDDLIENNKQRIARLEAMAEEVYREWFVRFRFPGHEGVRKVKGLPVGWTPTPSNKVFRVMSGGTPHTDNPLYWDGDIPFFTPRDAGDGFYVLGTERTITQKGLDSCNSRLFKRNTIFITARGTVGKICLTHREMAMNQTCYALSPIENGEAYFHFLSMKNAIAYIRGISKSGVFDNIIVDTFKIVPIFMPPDSLILEFDEYATPIFKQIGALLDSNELLTKTRDLLLPRLISGKFSVDNLDIQFPPGMAEEFKAEQASARA